MITTTDIANILHKDCHVFGLDIVAFGEVLTGELEKERLTIHVKSQTPQKYWEKCFVDINLCVPDLRPNKANTIRLGELERMAKDKFKAGDTNIYDGTPYQYRYYTLSIEADTALKCHFVNCRLLFNVLNTI